MQNKLLRAKKLNISFDKEVRQKGLVYFIGGFIGGEFSSMLFNTIKMHQIHDNLLINISGLTFMSLFAFFATSLVAWNINKRDNNGLLQAVGLGSGLILALAA